MDKYVEKYQRARYRGITAKGQVLYMVCVCVSVSVSCVCVCECVCTCVCKCVYMSIKESLV